MSRIDEALKRVQPAADRRHYPVNAQAVFETAWEVTADESASAIPVEPVIDKPVFETPRATQPAHTKKEVVSFSSAWRERLASSPDGDADLIEQFRRLAAVLERAKRTNGVRSVMVTSAMSGDGKTLTAVNLALVLTESYRCKVLLVDADLRRPSIPSVWDLGEGVGLSDALTATSEQKLALVPVTPLLTLLPAGHRVANSIEALTSPRMRQILDEAASRFDWIILDAPPVGLTADARLLTELVGGTLFVVHAGQSQCPDVQKAIDTLGRDSILGVVLNGVDQRPVRSYYGAPRNTERG